MHGPLSKHLELKMQARSESGFFLKDGGSYKTFQTAETPTGIGETFLLLLYILPPVISLLSPAGKGTYTPSARDRDGSRV